jgi:glycosyltransferase involved in cell wall biosynthesis
VSAVRPRRVLLLKEALPAGGAERQLVLIARHLPPPWEARVWTMGGGPFVEVLERAGLPVDVRARRARLDMRPAVHLWRLLLEWRPDVVHSWDWMSSAAALPLCRALRIPVVDGTIRNGIARRRRSLPLRLVRAASARVVANSRAGLAAWRIDPDRGRVVYNGFDPDRLALCPQGVGGSAGDDAGRKGVEAGREGGDAGREGGDAGRAGRPFTVAMTGRMVPHKDFATVIVAARLLADDGGGEHPSAGDGRASDRSSPALRVLLLGTGPDRARLEALAGDLVARDVVHFVDPGLEVLPHLRGVDAGVLMSEERLHREGCSNAIMEYMACGLPVVCSGGGGNPELVVAGETGYLVPAGDAGALAARLRDLGGDPALRARLGAAGRARLLREFTVERMVGALTAIYDEVVSP